jgi:hypothetical protein
MGLCVSEKVSFIFNLCLLKSYEYYVEVVSVFSDWCFFSVCSISNVWSIVPYVSFFKYMFKCILSLVFVFMTWIFSLYILMFVIAL